MEVSRAIDLIDDKMCWGRGAFSVHHMPEYDQYWQAGEMAIDALGKGKDVVSKGDMIYRQDAIRVVSGLDSSFVKYIKELPLAQPEPVRINLNELIKAKLTDWGKEIYYHQYDRTNQIVGRKVCKPMFPKEDENGYTEFQLWCFIELYGEHMGMTLPNVIEPLEIVYERRTG